MNEAEKIYWFKTTKNPDLMFVYNLHNWYFKKFFLTNIFLYKEKEDELKLKIIYLRWW